VPINPYANSKYFVEKILEDFARSYDLKYMILRYFNAAGLDGEAGFRRLPSSYNFLIPKAILSILEDQPLSVFGTDYPTPDGTAIRDYIHVKDLANAHVLALQHLLSSQTNASINLGTGKGYSVFEILNAVKRIARKEVPITLMPRREGDAPEAVADPELSKKILHFTPQFSELDSMIQSEWDFFH
jgi:UDP-arabinose 4-epimerase